MDFLSYKSLVANKIHNIQTLQIIIACFLVSSIIAIVAAKKYRKFFLGLILVLTGLFFVLPKMYSFLILNKFIYDFIMGIARQVVKYGFYILVVVAGLLIIYAVCSIWSMLSFKALQLKHKKKKDYPESYSSQLNIVNLLCRRILKKMPRSKRNEIRNFFRKLAAYFKELETQLKQTLLMRIDEKRIVLKHNMEQAISINQLAHDPETRKESFELTREYQAQYNTLLYMEQERQRLLCRINNIIAKLHGYELTLDKNRATGDIPEDLLKICYSNSDM